jgi:hypothetical protein
MAVGSYIDHQTERWMLPSRQIRSVVTNGTVCPVAHDIFISYASPDLSRAKQAVEILRENGYSSWFAPTDIRGGDTWPAEIARNIAISRAAVVLVSQSCARSQHVPKEVLQAFQDRKPIIPVSLDQSDPPENIRHILTGTQFIRFDAVQMVEAVDHKLGKRRKVAIRVPNLNESAAADDAEENPYAIVRIYKIRGSNKRLHVVRECPSLRIANFEQEDLEVGDLIDLCFEEGRDVCTQCLHTLRSEREGEGTLVFEVPEIQVHTDRIIQHREGWAGLGAIHKEVPYSAVLNFELVNLLRTGIKVEHQYGDFEINFGDERRRDVAFDILWGLLR